MNDRGREVWRISVIAADDGQPPVHLRVRKWIKNAKRVYGLRVIWDDCSEPTGGPGLVEGVIVLPDESEDPE